jgi:flagellar protein FliS
MNANALAAKYKTVQVTTSSPGEILLMLYEGIFRFLAEAQIAMKAKERARCGEKISRVHAILTELVSSLNFKQDAQLCARLQSLYLYSMDRLVEANVRQDPSKLAEIDRVLRPVYEGYKIVVRNPNQAAEEIVRLQQKT